MAAYDLKAVNHNMSTFIVLDIPHTTLIWGWKAKSQL